MSGEIWCHIIKNNIPTKLEEEYIYMLYQRQVKPWDLRVSVPDE
jgi:hypothetical protein